MNRFFAYTILACALLACAVARSKTRRQPPVLREPLSPIAETAPRTSASQQTFTEIHGRPGFWRVARTTDGVWWFLGPDSRTEFLNGVTTVQPLLRGRDPRGTHFVSRDFQPGPDDAGLRRWASAALRRVRGTGFKSLGAWSNPILHQYDVPMSRDLNVWQWVPYGCRLFSPGWRAGAEEAIRAQAIVLRANRNLLGYYTDNELNWSDGAVGPRAYFDQLPYNDPNRLEVIGVIRHTWSDLADFNRDWNTTFHDWAELERHPVLPRSASNGYDRLWHAWLYHFARAYFRITADLIHKYDPNHLLLGCRYRGWAPAEVARASRGITDAQSLNYYAADALLDPRTFATIFGESRQPLVISEYSFHALDGRSGDKDRARFPALVRDQAARARGYQEMTARLARVPYVIGADWFQWMDEPPSGRLCDGEDVNFGIVDVHDRGYDPLIEAVRQTAPLLDTLHSGSSAALATLVWRGSPSPRAQLAGEAAELMQK